MDWEKLAAVAKDVGMNKEETLKFFENAERVEQERAREQHEREKELAREQHEREKEILELKLRLAEMNACPRSGPSNASTPTTALDNSTAPRPKLVCPRKLMAPFDERRDDLDAYLHRFERIAVGQGWEKSGQCFELVSRGGGLECVRPHVST